MCIKGLVHFVALNLYLYIFENLIDIIIFQDILLSLIGALFKYFLNMPLLKIRQVQGGQKELSSLRKQCKCI